MSSTSRAPTPTVTRETGEAENRAMPFYMEPEPEPVKLLPYLQLLWADRKVLLRAALVSLLASALIVVLIPNRYRTITRLMPPDNQSAAGMGLIAALSGKGGLGGLGSMGGMAGDLLGMKSSGALFVGVLGSQTVQDRLIHQFNLQKVYWDSKIEDARKDLAEHTDVSEDRKSGIISIGVTDHDPQRSAAMARAYVDQLDVLVAHVSTSSARRERIFLEDRLKTAKDERDTAAKKFSNFASKNTALDIPAQGKAMVEAAATLQGRLIAAQAEVSGLRQIYTGNNVRVRAAEARVNEVRQKLNELGGGDMQDNAKDTNPLFPSIRKLPVLGVTYADLFLQTKIQETVYELLTEQYEMAKVQEAKEIPSVKVLDDAVVPTKKAFPPRPLFTIFGTLLGLAAAMAWIILKNRWDAVEVSSPGKVFATEVFTAVRTNLPGFSRNGHGAETGNSRWSWSSQPPKDDENKSR